MVSGTDRRLDLRVLFSSHRCYRGMKYLCRRPAVALGAGVGVGPLDASVTQCAGRHGLRQKPGRQTPPTCASRVTGF